MRYSLRRAVSLDSVDGGTHNPMVERYDWMGFSEISPGQPPQWNFSLREIAKGVGTMVVILHRFFLLAKRPLHPRRKFAFPE
jgi:hypothetical protein